MGLEFGPYSYTVKVISNTSPEALVNSHLSIFLLYLMSKCIAPVDYKLDMYC